MTTKVFKSLSNIENPIQIIMDSGIAGTANMDPCRYQGAVSVGGNIHVHEADCDETDEEDDMNMIWLPRR